MMPPAETPPAPTPAAYRPEFAEEARKWALMRATDEVLAGHFEVPLATLREWLETVPAFAQAVRSGRKMGDADVVDRYHKNAMGYAHDAVKIFRPVGTGEPLCVTYTRHYPPHEPAGKFWLINRLPGEWRLKVEIETSQSDADPGKLSRPELNRRIAALSAARGFAPEERPG
jgi:hypothetical protein